MASGFKSAGRASLLGIAVAAGLLVASPAFAEADPEYLTDRAARLLSSGDIDAALADLNEAIRLSPKLARAYLNRGVAHSQKGDPAKALADYDASIAIEPMYPAYTSRGAVYARRGDYDRAIADYKSALKLEPLSSITLMNLATVYKAAGRYGEALDAVDHSHRLKTEPRAQVIRGDILLDLADYPGAVKAYTKAIVTLRRYTNAYRSRAYAQLKLGEYQLAMDDADKAISLEPERVDLLNERCWLRAMAGRDLPQALADCDKALSAEPDNSNFLHSRAYVHLQSGALAAAEADLKRADGLRPADADVLYLLGVVKLRQGREAEARADISRSLTIRPTVSRDYTALGLPAWAMSATPG